MAGFLTHLVQRTLAPSPAARPGLAVPPDDATGSATVPDGEEVFAPPGDAIAGATRVRQSHRVPDAGNARVIAPAVALLAAAAVPPDPAAPVVPVAGQRHEPGPPPESPSVPRVTRSAPDWPDVPAPPAKRPESPAQAPPATRLVGEPPRIAEVPQAPAPRAATAPVAPPNAPSNAPPDAPANALAEPGPREPGPAMHQPSVARHDGVVNDARPEGKPTAPPAAPRGPVADGRPAARSIVPPVDATARGHGARAVAGLLAEPAAARPVSRRDAGLGAPADATPAATAAPSVQVTIGRIELRASTAPPAAAPRRPEAPRPSLGLADYLARRDAAGSR